MKWRQQRAADVDPTLAMLKSKRKAAHSGLLGQLKPLEQVLLRYIFKHCEQGMTVHTFDLVIKASAMNGSRRRGENKRGILLEAKRGLLEAIIN